MTYTVTYKPSAEADLVELWLNAGNRQAVADAANRIDRQLGNAPQQAGESRGGGTRVFFERPLAVQFEIKDTDQIVEVLKVWWIGA